MESPLYTEVKTIAAIDPTDGHYDLTVNIETPEVRFKPLAITEYNIDRDFNNKFTETRFISVLVGYGTYLFDIYPYKEELNITVSRKLNKGFNGDVTSADNPYPSRRYKAELKELPSSKTDASTNNLKMKDELDRESQIELVFELINPAIVDLSMMLQGATLRDVDTTTATKALLNLVLSKLDHEETNAITKVDVVDGDDLENVRSHVIIPSNTYVREIPRLIQENNGGVYGTGLGHFIQNGCWYVYPKFNTKRVQDVKRHLTLYNVPKTLLPNVENTYIDTGDVVKVISTGLSKETDNTDKAQLKTGHGTRYFRGYQFMNGYSSLVKDGATITRDDNVVEYATNERKNGLFHIPYNDPLITSNHLLVASRQAEKMIRYITVVWEHADPDILYPGMPVRFHYIQDENTTESIDGVLYSVLAKGVPKTNTALNNEFSMNVVLVIALEKEG